MGSWPRAVGPGGDGSGGIRKVWDGAALAVAEVVTLSLLFLEAIVEFCDVGGGTVFVVVAVGSRIHPACRYCAAVLVGSALGCLRPAAHAESSLRRGIG